MCVCNWADKWRSGPGPVSVTTEYTRLRQSQSELAFYAAAWILALEHVCGFLLWLSLQEREPTGSWPSEGLLAGSGAMDNSGYLQPRLGGHARDLAQGLGASLP